MNKFIENKYKNIPWITIINSWKEWKNIWLIAVTHWNEPVWIQIFDYLVNDFKIDEKIKTWKIYLIANNIKAYKKYLQIWDINSYRFIDDNMNRISNKEYKKWSYEFKRFEELKPIFNEIDICIDIHSVSKWNDLIWLTDEKYINEAKDFFDVETILVDDMWKTWAVIWEFIRNNKKAYGIECGNHIDKTWFKNWIRNIKNFLIYYWFINWNIIKSYNDTQTYQFIKEIRVNTNKFRYLKDFKWFTKIKNNEVFAIDENIKIQHNLWDDIYIWIVAKNPKKWDGAWFLFKKIK